MLRALPDSGLHIYQLMPSSLRLSMFPCPMAGVSQWGAWQEGGRGEEKEIRVLMAWLLPAPGVAFSAMLSLPSAFQPRGVYSSPLAAETNDHKMSSHIFSYSSGDQGSKISFIGLKSMCQLFCFPFWKF